MIAGGAVVNVSAGADCCARNYDDCGCQTRSVQ